MPSSRHQQPHYPESSTTSTWFQGLVSPPLSTTAHDTRQDVDTDSIAARGPLTPDCVDNDTYISDEGDGSASISLHPSRLSEVLVTLDPGHGSLSELEASHTYPQFPLDDLDMFDPNTFFQDFTPPESLTNGVSTTFSVQEAMLPFLNGLPSTLSSEQQYNMDAHFRNSDFVEFLHDWSLLRFTRHGTRRDITPDHDAVAQMESTKTVVIGRQDLDAGCCDMQGINWENLQVTREQAAQQRKESYKNYRSLLGYAAPQGQTTSVVNDDGNYFRFRRMDFRHLTKLSHFQLRNMMVAASRDRVFYASRCKVMQYEHTTKSVAMNLEHSSVASAIDGLPAPSGILVTSLATGHDVLVAGGSYGEYALMHLRSPKGSIPHQGIVTTNRENITNHIQVCLGRSSETPLVAFASNDMYIRTLDATSAKFVREHQYPFAINCTSQSPDRRLRVMVGDGREVIVCDAESGRIFHRLEGHTDYGFACDWQDGGHYVATGNQDMTIKIWDARKWTDASGRAQPVTTMKANMAGVRKLKFSPLSSGKPVLVAAEPADYLSIIDADTFASKQTINFFGEIAGFDFADSGKDLYVANADPDRGGIMEFERCGHQVTDYFRASSSKDHSLHGAKQLSNRWTNDNAEVQRTMLGTYIEVPIL